MVGTFLLVILVGNILLVVTFLLIGTFLLLGGAELLSPSKKNWSPTFKTLCSYVLN